MIFGTDRDRLRRIWIDVRARQRAGEALEPLERTLADVIDAHPEYHRVLEDPEGAGREWTPEGGETNPFLHMGMHVAIREQTATDRPAGIGDAYAALVRRLGDDHAADHAIMECLGEALWEAQRDGRAPDEEAYLDCVRRLARGSHAR